MDIIKQINREIHFRSAVPFLRLPRFQLIYTYSVRFNAPNCLIILFHVVTEDGTREHKLPNLFLCVSALVRHTIYWSVFHTHTHTIYVGLLYDIIAVQHMLDVCPVLWTAWICDSMRWVITSPQFGTTTTKNTELQSQRDFHNSRNIIWPND